MTKNNYKYIKIISTFSTALLVFSGAIFFIFEKQLPDAINKLSAYFMAILCLIMIISSVIVWFQKKRGKK